jgi:Tol biopolymer transport system component
MATVYLPMEAATGPSAVDDAPSGPAPDGGGFSLIEPPAARGVGACALPADAASRWIAFASTRDGILSDLYLVRADGSAVGSLLVDGHQNVEPAISPDGRWLAFASAKSYFEPDLDVYVMDLETYAVRQLTFQGGSKPSWSPDSQTIAFWYARGISVVPAAGGTPRRLAPQSSGQDPVFTPDGTGLVYSAGNGLNFLAFDGGTRPIVPSTPGASIGAPAITPDGLTVAFEYDSYLTETIALVPFTGSTNAPQAEKENPSGWAGSPAWGPDGVLAFGYAPPGLGPAGIAVSTAPGSPPCMLVTGTANNGPSWAPAGFQPHR